jgi:hypothetical protein
MAGAGICVGRGDYRTLCGLYFLRHEIAQRQRKQLTDAIIAALGGSE